MWYRWKTGSAPIWLAKPPPQVKLTTVRAGGPAAAVAAGAPATPSPLSSEAASTAAAPRACRWSAPRTRTAITLTAQEQSAGRAATRFRSHTLR